MKTLFYIILLLVSAIPSFAADIIYEGYVDFSYADSATAGNIWVVPNVDISKYIKLAPPVMLTDTLANDDSLGTWARATSLDTLSYVHFNIAFYNSADSGKFDAYAYLFPYEMKATIGYAGKDADSLVGPASRMSAFADDFGVDVAGTDSVQVTTGVTSNHEVERTAAHFVGANLVAKSLGLKIVSRKDNSASNKIYIVISADPPPEDD